MPDHLVTDRRWTAGGGVSVSPWRNLDVRAVLGLVLTFLCLLCLLVTMLVTLTDTDSNGMDTVGMVVILSLVTTARIYMCFPIGGRRWVP